MKRRSQTLTRVHVVTLFAIRLTAAGAIGLATLNGEIVPASPPAARTATDWVQLGRLSKGKLMITRLGMGTGSHNGRVQMELRPAGLQQA
jgi:hypothetical protein